MFLKSFQFSAFSREPSTHGFFIPDALIHLLEAVQYASLEKHHALFYTST
jgi:hypothetical protein